MEPELLPGMGWAGRDDGGLGVDELEDALAGGHGGLEDVVFFAEVLNGTEEALGVLDETDEDADADDVAEDAPVSDVAAGWDQIPVMRDPGESDGVEDGDAAAPEDEGDGGGGEELDDRVVPGVGEDGVGPGAFVLGVDGGEGVEGALFAVEELDYRHPRDVFLGKGVDPGSGGALATVAVADAGAEDASDEENGGDDGERKQGERPALPDHNGDDETEGEDVFEDGEHAGGEHLVEGVDVGGETGDEAADGVAVVEGGRHALQVAEDLLAHVEHDLLAGPLHEVGLEEFEQEGEEQRAKVDGSDERDAAHGSEGMAAEMAGEPGELLGRRGGHVSVDGDHDEQGADAVGRGLEEGGDGGDGDLRLVGAQVSEQAAHETAVVGFAGDVVVLRAAGGGFGVGLGLLGFLVVGHPNVFILDGCGDEGIRFVRRLG
jgi:hypothetical protein